MLVSEGFTEVTHHLWRRAIFYTGTESRTSTGFFRFSAVLNMGEKSISSLDLRSFGECGVLIDGRFSSLVLNQETT